MNLGDVVMLKSGGPKMTLSRYDTLLKVWICQWFEKNKLVCGTFKEESLELAKDAENSASADVI